MPAGGRYEYSESLTGELKQKKEKRRKRGYEESRGWRSVQEERDLSFSPQIFDRCAEDIPGIFSFSLLLSAPLASKKERKRKGKGKNKNFQKLSFSMRSPFFGKRKNSFPAERRALR